jgi:CPA2 family monovalent cation:H+ antiporter-2
LPLLATVAIILLGKSIAAYMIVRAFGHSGKTALTVAASLAQIGEFSFILAALGTELGMLPAAGRDLILAGAIISIFANPFIFSLIVSRSEEASAQVETPPPVEAAKGHVILIGYGRVGSIVARELANRDTPFVVIENETDMAGQAKTDGFNVLHGNALDPRTLEAAGIGEASTLLLAIPEGFEAGAIFQHVRQLRPDLRVIARAHSDAEVDHLQRLGVPEVIMGEREIAARMLSLTAAKRSVAALRPVT